MKANVLGFEISQGVSKKTGKPYAIGRLFVALPLTAASGEGNTSKGAMGSQYECEVSVLDKIKHLSPPFAAELEQQDVMRFGERKQQIVSVVPVVDQKRAA